MAFLISLLVLSGLLFAEPHIVIEEAWVRAVPPVSKMSAAFFRIRNTGDEDDYLIAVRSPASRKAEIHTTLIEDGTMRMRRLREVRVPAGEVVEFRPMGRHVMLIDLKRSLREGDRVRLTLVFRKSGEISVEARVRKVRMMH